ncbi:1701_t:CDS:2, partial [Dentiscutata heterogama]
MNDSIKSFKKPKKQKCNKENKSPAKRKSLTGTQKAEICYLKQKGISQVKLAKQFSIAEFPLLEEALALWVSRITKALQTVTEIIIQHKAVQLAEGLDIMESGEPPEPLNIKNVIDFTATAWKK